MFIDLFAHPTGRVITLILMHFVWQGFAVQFLLIAIQQLTGIRRVGARYSLSLAALFLMALCPWLTLTWLLTTRGWGDSAGLLSAMATANPAAAAGESLHRGLSFNIVLIRWVVLTQPYVLAAWAVGVILVGGRLLMGVVGLSRLRRGCMPLSPELLQMVERLRRELRMRSLPAVYLSAQVSEAMAVGLVRPLVLIPASWALEMPLDMLEAIMAHELAHLRRRDLWINFLQRIVEAFLFYHPAVWWLSQRLRVERELCTDELAVAVTGQRLAYVQALEQVAHRRRADVRPALAAFLRGETNMRLLERVQNVLGLSAREQSRLWPAGLVALLLPVGLWMVSIGQPTAIADDDDDKPVLERKIKRQAAEDQDEERGKPQLKRQAIDELNALEKRYLELKRQQLEADASEPQKKPVKAKQPVKSDLFESKVPGKPGSREQHVIEELAAAVKKLSAQVEKLQAEVAELRGEQPKKSGKKDATFYDYFEAKPDVDKQAIEKLVKQKLAAIAAQEQAIKEGQKDQRTDYERAVKEKFLAEVEQLKAQHEAMQQKMAAELKKNEELLQSQAAKGAEKVQQFLREQAEANKRKADEAAARAEQKAAIEKEREALKKAVEAGEIEKERALSLKSLEEQLRRQIAKEKEEAVKKEKGKETIEPQKQ